MKSLAQQIAQCEGLIGTKDINEKTDSFLTKVVNVTKARNGDTTWLSSGQVEWIEDIYDRHFA